MIPVAILIIFTVILPLSAIIFILVYGKLLKKQSSTMKLKPLRQRRKQGHGLYEALSSFSPIAPHLKAVKDKISSGRSMDEYAARRKTLYITAVSALLAIIVFLLMCRLYGSTLYMRAVMLVFSMYLYGFMAGRLAGSDSKLLESLIGYINDVKHYYHAFKMVDEAIYEAAVKSDAVMEGHGKEIYRIVTSSEGEKGLEAYYEKCPNKFLKILAGFSYMVKEYGDKKVDGVSLYIKNLNYIIEEIYLEIIKKSQLSYWLKGLPVITLLPILFPPWIENWMGSSFPASKEFFQSSTAFFLKNLIIFLIVICYLFISKLQKDEGSKKKTTAYYNTTAEQNALKIVWLQGLVSLIKPKNSSLRYKRLAQLLQEAGSSLSIDAVYLRKLSCGITAGILLIAIFITSHVVNINAAMNDASYGIKNSNLYLMLGKVSAEEQISRDEINRYDAEILRLFSKNKSSFSGSDAVEKIKGELEKKSYAFGDAGIAAERIYNKLNAKAGERLRVWEVLLSLLIAFMLSNIPVWMLLFEKAMRKADMQDEVFQFHTVILLLMHHQSVDVRKVLEWMHQLSDVFREPINRCLNNFHDPKAALQKLKEDVKFKEFVYLIENLEMANDRISIKEAFDSLELDRDFYREHRKEVNKRTVNSRIEIGKLIGFIPFYGTIILYLVLPLIFVSFTSLRAIIEQLGSK